MLATHVTDASITQGPSTTADEYADEIFALLHRDARAALSIAETELRAEKAIPLPVHAAMALVLARVHWTDGQLAEARARSKEALDVTAKIADTYRMRYWRAHSLLEKASQLSDRFKLDQAEQTLLQAVDTRALSETDRHVAAPLIQRARLLLRSGQAGHARGLAKHTLALAGRFGADEYRCAAIAVAAEAATRQGDHDEVSRMMNEFSLVRGEYSRMEPISASMRWIELIARSTPQQRTADAVADDLSSLATRRAIFIGRPGAAPWLVRKALRSGDGHAARLTINTARELAAGNPGYAELALSADHASGIAARDHQLLYKAYTAHRDVWARGWAAVDLAELCGTGSAEGRQYLRVASSCFRLAGRSLDTYSDTIPIDEGDCDVLDDTRDIMFSSREQEVIELVSAGMTNRKIAEQLSISTHTVNYHLRKIYGKLKINSRTALASFCRNHRSSPRSTHR